MAGSSCKGEKPEFDFDLRVPIADNPELRSGHFALARRRPRRTKSAPAVRLSRCAMLPLLRNRWLKLEANQARTRHQIVPVITKLIPSIRNAAIFMDDAGSLNCGRNARKNNATFGFRTLVSTPCRKAARVVPRRNREGKANSLVRSMIILIPRKTRYAPPRNLIAAKACADAARIAEIPSAAAQVWKILPKEIPKADATPAWRPCATLRPKM